MNNNIKNQNSINFTLDRTILNKLDKKKVLLINLAVVGLIITIVASIGLGVGIPLAIPAAIKSAIYITGIIVGLILTITLLIYKIILQKKPTHKVQLKFPIDQTQSKPCTTQIQPKSSTTQTQSKPPINQIQPKLISISIEETSFQKFSETVFKANIQEGEALLNQPELKLLKEMLLSTPIEQRRDLFHCLHVLLGIKPILAIEKNSSLIKNLELVKKLNIFNSNCFLHISENQTSYFINQKPLPIFDPKRYILPEKFSYENYLEAIQDNFYLDKGNSESIVKTQFVSYLLGFGPTWEAYICNSSGRFKGKFNQEQNREKTWIFSPLHYQELSLGLKATNHQIISGKEYSLNLILPDKGIYKNTLIDELIDKLYLEQVIDPISVQTPYIQASLNYRHNLVEIISQFLPLYPPSKKALNLFKKN